MEAEVTGPERTTRTTAIPPGNTAAVAAKHARVQGGRALPQPAAILLLALLVLLSVLLATTQGAVHIAASSILRSVMHANSLTPTEQLILLHIRLPRVVAAALVGAALSVAGLLFQGLFRNPLADPYILGASGGSVLGAGLGIFLLGDASMLGFSAAAVMAFAGAVTTMLVVYLLARSHGRTNTVTLLLAGFAIGTVLANSTYIFEVADRNAGTGTRALAAWMYGVISTPQWRQLEVAASVIAVALIASIPLTRRLNTLALGEEYAQQLGVAVEHSRIFIIIVGSLLTAMAVALGGLISFAGLIVPHVVRMIFGADNTRLLPLTALTGAAFLVLADTLARTVLAPSEIPVGLLMAGIGGPFFLYLLRHSRRSYAL